MARNYKQEYANYQGTAEQKKNRAKRNKARRSMMKAGKVSKGDGKDVGHKVPLKNGGSNGNGNWQVQSVKSNRSEGGRIGDKKGKAKGGRKGGKK